MTVKTVKTYYARRRLTIGEGFREPPAIGEPVTPANLVPECVLWPKYESLLHFGRIAAIEVSVEELFASFELHQLSAAECMGILERMGLKDGIELQGPHSSPRAPAKAPAKRAAKQLHASRKGGPGTLRKRAHPVATKMPPAVTPDAKPPAMRIRAKKTTTRVTIPMNTLAEAGD